MSPGSHERRVAFAALIAEIATRFATRRGLDVDDGEIELALERTGAFLEVDRCYVFLLRPDRSRIDNTHEWCAPGIEPQRQALQDLRAADAPWFMQKVLSGEVVHVEDVAALPAEAATDRALLEEQGIRSLLAVPIVVASGTLGFVGFDAVRARRTWDDETRDRLRLLAVVLGGAIHAGRTERAREDLDRSVQATQRLESLGLLAGEIAHDFNNLLSGVLGHAELALRAIDRGDADAGEHVGRIARVAQQLAALCRQLIAYSGRGQLHVEPVDVDALIHDLGELLAIAVAEDVQLTVARATTPCIVDADPSQLRQVVLNLVTNAAEATRGAGGHVALKTTVEDCDAARIAAAVIGQDAQPGRFVVVEVDDDGSGIAAGDLPRMFEPFFSTKGPGRGLGLAALAGIVRAQHGAVEVDTEPGRGTRVRVLLPAASGVLASVPAPADAVPTGDVGGAVRRALVVDDEELVRDIGCAILRDAGLLVDTAADGPAAIDAVARARTRYDVAVVDLRMPGLSGLAVVRRLRELDPGLRIVLTSGYAHETPAELADADAFLAKPFRRHELLDAIGGAPRDVSP